MKVYLAGDCYTHKIEEQSGFDFFRLDTFASLNNKKAILIKNYKDFILDSGAFSFIKKNPNINWDDYIIKYANFINEYSIEKFFELDIDVIVGLKEVERLRSKLEKLTNKKCIPVWHKSRGKEYWLKMVKDYDYVAIGGIAIKVIKKNQFEFLNWFLYQAKKENCKVHGLGFILPWVRLGVEKDVDSFLMFLFFYG
jgi:hypothetical protein